MRYVITYLKPYLSSMSFGFLLKIIGTFTDLGLPWVLAYIIDDVIPTEKISLIFFWGGIMLVLALITRIFNVLANRSAAHTSKCSIENLGHDLFYKINHLSGSQIDKFTIPSLISRMTSDIYNIHRMFNVMQRLGVRAPLLLIGGIIITSTLDPVLALVLTAVLPFIGFIVFFISRHGIPLYDKVQHATDDMVRTVRESITGIRIIKSLSKTKYEKKHFGAKNDQVVSKEWKAGKTMAASSPVINLFLNLGLTAVIIVGAYRINAGSTEPGKIVAFLSYFTIILNAVIAMTRIFVVYSKASASAARIAEVLNTKEDLAVLSESEINAKLSIESPKNVKSQNHIEFSHVTFHYHEAGENSLDDISFKLKSGESLGIIGSTGSGKTTIVNLLMRFYDVSKGSIRIHGKDIRTMPLQELRSMFGAAFQNDIIFQDSIFENINFGRELSREDVSYAAMNACASSFINTLDEGYDYSAAIKGANLSGGQKQRLYISRALAGHPEILVLDDSSSALDYKTDAALRKAINANYNGITNITITQRISSILHMDHILVLEDGKTLGYGTHDELLKTCEVYREIYESQMGS